MLQPTPNPSSSIKSGTNVGFYHEQDSPRCVFLYALSLEFITDRFNRQPRVKWVVWYIIHLYCTLSLIDSIGSPKSSG